jgi:hypothetical protein
VSLSARYFSLQTGSPEAQRRIKFFVNTLLMERPTPQRAISQPSWSTLTPYYEEDVILPLAQLKKSTEVLYTATMYSTTAHVACCC